MGHRWLRNTGTAAMCLLMAAAPSEVARADGRRDQALPPAAAKRLDAYWAWLSRCIGGLRSEIPALTRSAVDAADRFVTRNYKIGAFGDPAFVGEFTGRAGGLMPVTNPSPESSNTVVLYMPQEARLADELKALESMRAHGCFVVAFAGGSGRHAQEIRRSCDAFVDTHAAPHDGLFAPTDLTAAIAAVWTWTGEFVSACTRLGKMPVMWQSIMVPGSAERNRKYSGLTFHDGVPQPVAAGALGSEYLNRLAENVRTVLKAGRGPMLQAVRMAQSARQKGGRLYAYLFGHATFYFPDEPGDPGIFQRANIEWNKLAPNTEFGPKDFALGLGYDGVLSGDTFDHFAEKARSAGMALAWSFTDYKPEEARAIRKGELYIDQHWPLGDAVVVVPGYDVQILPTSGVVAAAIYWSIGSALSGGAAAP